MIHQYCNYILAELEINHALFYDYDGFFIIFYTLFKALYILREIALRRILLLSLITLLLAGCGRSEATPVIEGAYYEAPSTINANSEQPLIAEDQPTIVVSDSIDPVQYADGYQSNTPITATNVNQIQELIRVGKGTLSNIIWSGDSRKFAAIGTGSVQIFDADNVENEPQIFTNTLPPFAISYDGDMLATATEDSPLVILDTATGSILANPTLPENLTLRNVGFNPDHSELAAISSEGDVLRWSIGDNFAALESDSSIQIMGEAQLFYDANETLFVVELRGSHITLTQVEREAIVLEFETPDHFQTYIMSSDESMIGLPVIDDAKADHLPISFYRVFDTQNGEQLGEIPYENSTTTFSAAGETYLSFLQNAIEIRQMRSDFLVERINISRVLRTLDEATIGADTRMPAIPLSSRQLDLKNIDVSPSGQQVVLSYRSGEIIVIDLQTGDSSATTGAFSPPMFDAWLTPDTRTLIVSTAFSVDVWDLATGHGRFGVRRPNSGGFVMHPSGETFVIGESSIMAYDTDSLLPERPLRSSGQANMIAFDDDGTILAWMTDQYGSARIHFRDLVNTDQPIIHIPLAAGQGFVPIMAFSPTGETVAEISGSGNFSVYDVKTLTPLIQLTSPDTNYHRLAYTPDGHTIAFSAGTLPIRAVDIFNDDEHVLSDTGFFVISLAYSPDGTILAAGGIDSILLLDASSGGILHVLAGLNPYTENVHFSTDGHYLISASSDGTVRLWGIPES